MWETKALSQNRYLNSDLNVKMISVFQDLLEYAVIHCVSIIDEYLLRISHGIGILRETLRNAP